MPDRSRAAERSSVGGPPAGGSIGDPQGAGRARWASRGRGSGCTRHGGPIGRYRGFTLVELLITILLVSLLFSFALLFMQGLSSTRKMRDYEIAIALTQQAIEALRSAPFGMLDDADAGELSLEKDFNTAKGQHDMYEPTFMSGGIKYERTVVVETIPPAEKAGTPPGLKHAKVTVKWAAPDGEKLAYEVTTVIADLR